METVDPPLTVLLVEDNPNDARLIRRHLTATDTAFLPDDVVLHHEATLDAGLDRLDGTPVDVVLLDLGLPESDGAATFERAREPTREVPVVVLTNLQDERTAVDILQQGAQDYLNKGSLDEEQLVKAIRYALERQEQKQKLQATTEQLAVLNRIFGHDVRNDVQLLQLWSESLIEELPPDKARDLRKIRETSEHIQELSASTGDFVEVVTGDGSPASDAVRLDSVLRDELDKAQSAYADATFEVAGGLPAVHVSANEMLSSVFRNLLNNAVQHNDGDAHVEVAVDTGPETARVTVTDDGPGIPEDRQGEIFGKGEHGLESDGTGLGLYLVHTLVTAFDGDVRAGNRSNGTSGAVFTVELPVTEPDDWVGG